MINFPLIDLSVVALVVALTLILALYNRRQAVAIEQIRNLAEDLVAMQIRDRRAKREGSLADLDARTWLEGQAQAVAEKPIKVVSIRTLPAVRVAELTLTDQSKILVSTLSKAELKRYDRQQKRSGSRLEAFAAKPILVGRYQVASRTLLDDEFLDLEASAVAQSLGLNWRNPARLWVYVF